MSNFKVYISFVKKAVSERMLAHPSEECGVGEIERGGDNPLGIKKRKKIPVMILVPWVYISHFKACAAGTMTAFFAGPLPCLDK